MAQILIFFESSIHATANRCNAREWLASGHSHILPLIPLMRGDEAELRAGAHAIANVPDEVERSELAAYLSIIGGLRYDRNIIRQIIGEVTMAISLRELESSSVYQAIRAQTVFEMLRRGVARYFPELRLGSEVETTTDLNALEDLCLTMHELPDAAALQARLAELMPSASGADFSPTTEAPSDQS